MIGKGKLVTRLPDKFCANTLNIQPRALKSEYPVSGQVCIVCRNPYEADFGDQDIMYPAKPKNHLILKKAIDVICDGHFYTRCMLSAFQEIKA